MLGRSALARAPAATRCLKSPPARPIPQTLRPPPVLYRRPLTSTPVRRNPLRHPDAEERLRTARPLFHRDTPRRVVRSPTTKKVVIVCSVSAALFFWWNLETVPVSGRRRFNIFHDDYVAALSRPMVREIELEVERAGGRFLPEWDPRVRLVRKVMRRLIPVSGGGELLEAHQQGRGAHGAEAPTYWGSVAEVWGGGGGSGDGDVGGSSSNKVVWEVRVIDDPALNAFVLPGGKVFVHSGILNVTRSEAGLAAVLGHEIAHNMASHVGERLSGSIGPNMLLATAGALAFFVPGAAIFVLAMMGGRLQSLLLDMPMSRKQEAEADHIGLMLMAEACYDPREAVHFWQRMARVSDEMGNEVPELLSTHPSNRSRIDKLQALMPEALQKWQATECHGTSGFVDVFHEALARGASLGDHVIVFPR